MVCLVCLIQQLATGRTSPANKPERTTDHKQGFEATARAPGGGGAVVFIAQALPPQLRPQRKWSPFLECRAGHIECHHALDGVISQTEAFRKKTRSQSLTFLCGYKGFGGVCVCVIQSEKEACDLSFFLLFSCAIFLRHPGLKIHTVHPILTITVTTILGQKTISFLY